MSRLVMSEDYRSAEVRHEKHLCEGDLAVFGTTFLWRQEGETEEEFLERIERELASTTAEALSAREHN